MLLIRRPYQSELFSDEEVSEKFTLIASNGERSAKEVLQYVRLNFFVPVPEIRVLEGLNSRMAVVFRGNLKRRLRAKSRTKAELI